MKIATPTRISVLLFLLLALPGIAAALQEPEDNVNSRYTVESARLSGADASRISKALAEEMEKLAGAKFDQEAAERIARRLREELPDFTIRTRVQRGEHPDHVKVLFEAERYWWKKFDLERSRIVYQSKEGWSGELSTTFGPRHSALTVGYVNNSDESLERNMGFRLGFEQRKLFTDRLRLRLGFESFNEKWNLATELAVQASPSVPGIYRERQNFAPSIAVLPWRDLEISVGASFQRLQTQYPEIHTDTASAGTFSVAYRHRFESGKGVRQRVSAEYRARTATRTLESDLVYTRHSAEGQYSAAWGRNYLSLRGIAGGISGAAPLFERFSLGNSLTLRGWNKFDVAPTGGSRVGYASIEYHYSSVAVFYDAGKVWDAGVAASFKHSAGFGFADRHGAFLLLGVPLRYHHVEPVVMFGIRF
jgi:hypothetical protein